MNGDGPRVTFLGRLISLALVAGVVWFGVRMVRQKGWWPRSAGGGGGGGTAAVSEVQREVPRLAAPAPYQLKDNTLVLEISEYAGYAGLIAANGGLAANTNSVFFKNGGFKVQLTMSEEESWSSLNSGTIGASVTTVDVLAVYGRQFHVVVPAQIGFSRGADGIVVRSDIKRVNDLKGRIVSAAQFTEVDFLIRYLAQEAGIGVRALDGLDAPPDPDRINIVYTDDGFSAGDLFLQDLRSGKNRLAGCVTWEPKVSEVVAQSNGKARLLTSNKNLLIIGDILIVNEGLAQQHPEIVAGLVRGLLEGNRMVRDHPAAYEDLVATSFKWTREKTRGELAKVHLANLPENLAFFSGAIDAGGSFAGIYQSAVLSYGTDVIPNPADPDHFTNLAALQALKQANAFPEQRLAIAPIRSASGGPLETNPLLSKDIRFLFEPNSATLDLNNADNLANLGAIKRLLQVSPGSTILLRGHVDNALVPEFRRRGGEAFVQQMALKAMQLSKDRAGEIRRLLVEREGADPKRLEVVKRDWEEPVSGNSDLNRRVEVQWFTIE